LLVVEMHGSEDIEPHFLVLKVLSRDHHHPVVNFSHFSIQSFKGAEKCPCALKGHTCYLKQFFTSLLRSVDRSKTPDNSHNL
jgi:hypothetical protein